MGIIIIIQRPLKKKLENRTAQVQSGGEMPKDGSSFAVKYIGIAVGNEYGITSSRLPLKPLAEVLRDSRPPLVRKAAVLTHMISPSQASVSGSSRPRSATSAFAPRALKTFRRAPKPISSSPMSRASSSPPHTRLARRAGARRNASDQAHVHSKCQLVMPSTGTPRIDSCQTCSVGSRVRLAQGATPASIEEPYLLYLLEKSSH